MSDKLAPIKPRHIIKIKKMKIRFMFNGRIFVDEKMVGIAVPSGVRRPMLSSTLIPLLLHFSVCAEGLGLVVNQNKNITSKFLNEGSIVFRDYYTEIVQAQS